MNAFASTRNHKPVTRLTFNNDQGLEVELKHKGAFFNIHELNALTLVLGDVPCQDRGLNALCNCWRQHQQYHLNLGFAEQFFAYVKNIDEVVDKIQSLNFPLEFHDYVGNLLEKLAWAKSLYLQIACLEEVTMGDQQLSSTKLLKMKPRKVIKNIDKLVQHAEKQALVTADWLLYKQSQILSSTFYISFSVEPCY